MTGISMESYPLHENDIYSATRISSDQSERDFKA